MNHHFIWLLFLAIACEPARSDVYSETIDDQIVAKLKKSADSIIPLVSDPISLSNTPSWVKGECLYFGSAQKTTRLWYDEQGRITGFVEFHYDKMIDSVQFFSNGQRTFTRPLDTVTGLLNGPARYYHPDGRVRQDGRFEKGIKLATVDVAAKTVTVIYNSEKTNPETIRKAISNIGYDADDVPANIKAYQKLEDCCKKDGHK